MCTCFSIVPIVSSDTRKVISFFAGEAQVQDLGVKSFNPVSSFDNASPSVHHDFHCRDASGCLLLIFFFLSAELSLSTFFLPENPIADPSKKNTLLFDLYACPFFLFCASKGSLILHLYSPKLVLLYDFPVWVFPLYFGAFSFPPRPTVLSYLTWC